jgi:Subtilase family
MPAFNWLEQVAPILPVEWQNCTGKGVKIAVIDTGLDTTHPALAHLDRDGHKFNTGLDGDPMLRGGMDDIRDRYKGIGHGTPGVSILSGKTLEDQSGLGGIAPEAEIFFIKAAKTFAEGGMVSDLYRFIDFFEGLQVAKALKADLVISSFTFDESQLDRFEITKAEADLLINELTAENMLLLSAMQDYEKEGTFQHLSGKFFPTWHGQSINVSYVPKPLDERFDFLKEDPGITFFVENLAGQACFNKQQISPIGHSNSMAVYVLAGILALAFEALKDQAPRSKAAVRKLFEQHFPKAATAGKTSLRILQGIPILV